MHKIFIDGSEGTTGLQIETRLAARSDLQLLVIDPARRKDTEARRHLINQADVVITCLPDAAAIETVSLISNPHTRVIDPSTAHRTAAGWIYGFPELTPGHREKVRQATRIAVPGCHATGFVAALRPLVDRGLVPRSYPTVVHSLTGYSGGGKKMIASYETPQGLPPALLGSRPYALGLQHKHLPEMKAMVGLDHAPLFQPVVGPFYKGMIVTVPLLPRLLPEGVTPEVVHTALSQHYAGERFVRVLPLGDTNHLDDGALSPLNCNDTNFLDLLVFGHADQILIAARLDNLGKGASGAAVQVLNLILGADEATGLA